VADLKNIFAFDLHLTELKKECSGGKFTRLDPEIKLKERDKKRLVQENIEFKANEREKDCSARKHTRLDPDIKLKERDKKRLHCSIFVPCNFIF
jgi:hypothetical protein